MAAPKGQTNCFPQPKLGVCYQPGGKTYVPYYSDGAWWCCDQFAGFPGEIQSIKLSGSGLTGGIGSSSFVQIPTFTPTGAVAPGAVSAMDRLSGLATSILAERPKETVASAVVGLAVNLGLSTLFPAPVMSAFSLAREQATMGLNLGGILQASSGILGGIDNSYFQTLSGITNLASQFVPVSPQVSYAPVYTTPQPMPQPQAQPVGLPIAVAAGAVTRMVAPLLTKIAVKLGLKARPTLNRAMDLVRKAGKILQSPEAVAVALGLTTAELATLIVSGQSRKRRRMNPANSKALRRAARRIKSFHRLCTHTDLLKSSGRRKSSRGCTTCKKSPCRC